MKTILSQSNPPDYLKIVNDICRERSQLIGYIEFRDNQLYFNPLGIVLGVIVDDVLYVTKDGIHGTLVQTLLVERGYAEYAPDYIEKLIDSFNDN